MRCLFDDSSAHASQCDKAFGLFVQIDVDVGCPISRYKIKSVLLYITLKNVLFFIIDLSTISLRLHSKHFAIVVPYFNQHLKLY